MEEQEESCRGLGDDSPAGAEGVMRFWAVGAATAMWRPRPPAPPPPVEHAGPTDRQGAGVAVQTQGCRQIWRLVRSFASDHPRFYEKLFRLETNSSAARVVFKCFLHEVHDDEGLIVPIVLLHTQRCGGGSSMTYCVFIRDIGTKPQTVHISSSFCQEALITR